MDQASDMVCSPRYEGDSRKLKRSQQQGQHFSEQWRQCVEKQKISIDESLINYGKEKREKETLKNCGF